MNTSFRTLQMYWNYNMKYKRLFLLVLFMLPVATLSLSIAAPYFFSEIIGKLIDFKPGDEAAKQAIYHLFYFVIIAKIIELISWRSISYIMPLLQARVSRDIEHSVQSWLLQLSYSFHINNFGGALITKGKRFVSEYERIFDTLYFDIITIFIRVVAIVSILMWRSPILGGAFTAWFFVYLLIVLALLRYKMPISKEAAKADSYVTANFADAITNIITIKSFGHEALESQRFKEVVDYRLTKRWRSWLVDAHIRTIQNIVAFSFEVSLLALSIYLVFEQKIDVQDVVLMQLYLLPLLFALWQLGRNLQGFERSLSDAAEMTEIFEMEPEVTDSKNAKPHTIKNSTIEFKNIQFGYESSEENAIFSNFNLVVKAKQKIGLVGPSGGGKTTLTKLLLRFMDVDSGTITIDGVNISSITQESLRQNIAYVSQEPILFHRSLLENIRYGNPKATEAQVVAAAKQAHAHEFIEKLPKQYETLVGERGTKLSGGEKQRVAIARAILKDAPILVLDEATSALDSESESLIQKALKELMHGRTTLVIAHRLSTIQNMDRIIVLSNGAIQEDGSHIELIKNNRLYAQLWQHQSGGFIKEQ